jgi:hypothetical protein
LLGEENAKFSRPKSGEKTEARLKIKATHGHNKGRGAWCNTSHIPPPTFYDRRRTGGAAFKQAKPLLIAQGWVSSSCPIQEHETGVQQFVSQLRTRGRDFLVRHREHDGGALGRRHGAAKHASVDGTRHDLHLDGTAHHRPERKEHTVGRRVARSLARAGTHNRGIMVLDIRRKSERKKEKQNTT